MQGGYSQVQIILTIIIIIIIIDVYSLKEQQANECKARSSANIMGPHLVWGILHSVINSASNESLLQEHFSLILSVAASRSVLNITLTNQCRPWKASTHRKYMCILV